MRSLIGGASTDIKANLILLVGGNGKLTISGDGDIKKLTKNFLVRSQPMFAAAGFLTAIADAPFDRRGAEGLLGGFRASSDHAADLAKLARKLNYKNAKPVIVIGTSRGTVSAANLAVRNPENNIAAVILTSSLVRKNKKGAALPDLPIDEIKIPVLFVHNINDGCAFTRLTDLKPLIAKMKTAGVVVDLIEVSSTKETSDPCKAMSRHGFLGIEAKVVDAIVQWINKKF